MEPKSVFDYPFPTTLPAGPLNIELGGEETYLNTDTPDVNDSKLLLNEIY
jgi:hypothetical protein